MTDPQLKDLEYSAEFERQQFALYDARRLALETPANAVAAVALAAAAFVVTDYGRDEAVDVAWLILALLGLGWAFVLANVARVVSWLTPLWRGGGKTRTPRPSDVVGDTLDASRDRNNKGSAALRQDAWLTGKRARRAPMGKGSSRPSGSTCPSGGSQDRLCTLSCG
jgi:hypothetical protein